MEKLLGIDEASVIDPEKVVIEVFNVFKRVPAWAVDYRAVKRHFFPVFYQVAIKHHCTQAYTVSHELLAPFASLGVSDVVTINIMNHLMDVLVVGDVREKGCSEGQPAASPHDRSAAFVAESLSSSHNADRVEIVVATTKPWEKDQNWFS